MHQVPITCKTVIGLLPAPRMVDLECPTVGIAARCLRGAAQTPELTLDLALRIAAEMRLRALAVLTTLI